MKQLFKQLITRIAVWEIISPIVTWMSVTGISLYFYSMQFGINLNFWLSAFVCCIFIISWLMATRDQAFVNEPATRLMLLALQFCCLLACYYLMPYQFVAIFGILFAAVLPHFLSVTKCLMTIPVLLLPMFVTQVWIWGNGIFNSFLSALLWSSFYLFAILMYSTTLKERKQREEISLLNQQLLATQKLLQQSARQSERLRIARNIHDVVGHHLTALAIKLQIAERLSNADAKQQIAECHSLAKLLLSDVRSAVDDIREQAPIDLIPALQQLADSVPNLKVELNILENVVVDDAEVAEAVFRIIQEAITNTLKHSGASEIAVTISNNENNQLFITIADNGKVAENMQPGNGLMGMEERIARLSGTLKWWKQDQHLVLQASLPVDR